jgi:glutamate-1-semialdehyde 2,1-aminomutase
MAVFSKAIGNGYPIGAVIGKADVMASAQKTFISSTYWTERIGPTAALATLRKHRALDAGKHLMDIGRQVQDGWRRIADRNGMAITVSGIPALGHFTFDTPDHAALKAFFVQEMLDRGFLASTSFYSMHAHAKRHVAAYLEAAEKVFAKMRSIRKQGQSVEERLRGEPAALGFRRLA